MKILVADDDPQLVRALRITLAAHGYDVVAAPDGAAAIDARRAGAPRHIRTVPGSGSYPEALRVRLPPSRQRR